MTATRSFTDADLNAYIDGELTGAERAAIEAWLGSDPEAAVRLKALRALDQRLKGTFEFVLDEPGTRAMQTAVLNRSIPTARPGWRWMSAAALAMLVAGSAGYLLRGWRDAQPTRPDLLAMAVGAHSVFSPEVRRPVEVAASEEPQLVKWLTKRVGSPVKVPVLQEQGFALVGGRLLPDVDKPAAQLMYETAKGERLTLYVRRDAAAPDSAFTFAQRGELAAFTWVDQPLAYALVGKLSRDDLQRVARSAYEQLQK